MASYPTVVKRGITPTQISGTNLSAGSAGMIYNQSTDTAIWVSSNQGQAKPGLGMRIGPLGTANWSNDAGVPWASCDTVATVDILVLFSDDVNMVVNPVDVGIATAIQIETLGVPNVLVDDTLVSLQTLAAGASLTLDVHRYAGLEISISGIVVPYEISYAFTDITGTVTFDSDRLSAPATLGPKSYGLAVSAPQFILVNSDLVNAVTVTIHGNNRVARSRIQANQGIANGALATAVIPGLGAVTLTPNNHIGGLCYAVFECTGTAGAAPVGYFEIVMKDGTLYRICSTGEMVAQAGQTFNTLGSKLIALPPSGFTIQFRCTVVPGSSTTVRMQVFAAADVA